MSESYYAYLDGVVSDLYTRDEIERMFADGIITSTTKICRAGETEWHDYVSLFCESTIDVVRPQAVHEPLEVPSPEPARKMTSYSADVENLAPKRRNLAYWIAVFSVTVVAAASAAAYFINDHIKTKEEAEKKTKREKADQGLSRTMYSARITMMLLDISTYSHLTEQVTSSHLTWWKLETESSYPDINRAIRKSMSRQSDRIKLLEKAQDKGEEAMLKLKNPPSGLEATHAELVELYGAYTSYLDLAVSPSGSLLSYNRECKRLRDEVLRRLRKMQVMTKE